MKPYGTNHFVNRSYVLCKCQYCKPRKATGLRRRFKKQARIQDKRYVEEQKCES